MTRYSHQSNRNLNYSLFYKTDRSYTKPDFISKLRGSNISYIWRIHFSFPSYSSSCLDLQCRIDEDMFCLKFLIHLSRPCAATSLFYDNYFCTKSHIIMPVRCYSENLNARMCVFFFFFSCLQRVKKFGI